jgi:hypothetical protein
MKENSGHSLVTQFLKGPTDVLCLQVIIQIEERDWTEGTWWIFKGTS